MEQRIIIGSRERSTNFSLRFRYRIQAKTPTIRIIVINQRIYFLVNYEIFLNLGKTVFEKYVNLRRLSLGMGFYISNSWWFELIYALQGSRRDSEDGFSSREQYFAIQAAD